MATMGTTFIADAGDGPASPDPRRAVGEAGRNAASLITSQLQLPPETRTSEVAERFVERSDIDAVAVVERDRPVGLVTRSKLMFRLFRRFGYELYSRKPITKIADPDPLTVAAGAPMEAILEQALGRNSEDLYDEVVVVDSDGTFLGLISIKQLVLEQSSALARAMIHKQLADRRAQELEAVAEMKSRFLANVTHELRSPVNVIIGVAELLERAYAREDHVRAGELITTMKSSATGLRSLVTNILDMSKLESGRMEVFHEPFDLAALVREVAMQTRILVGRKEVAVREVVPEGELIMESDPVKVKQVLINLAGNAAKYTDTGYIALIVRPGSRRIAIDIADTGSGIDPADLDRLFEAFEQLEHAHTKRHEGTGLGLAITKHLVDMLGGTIRVDSRRGVGSTFSVEIPRTPKS